MRRSRFSEEQIIGVLKEADAGIPVLDLCREHGRPRTGSSSSCWPRRNSTTMH
jgi:hypothetical protein